MWYSGTKKAIFNGFPCFIERLEGSEFKKIEEAIFESPIAFDRDVILNVFSVLRLSFL